MSHSSLLFRASLLPQRQSVSATSLFCVDTNSGESEFPLYDHSCSMQKNEAKHEMFCTSMNNCIVLDDDEDCVMVDESENADKPKSPDEPPKPKKSIKFQKALIAQVRKHRFLYDNKHKLFSNVAKKEMVWQQIAKHLNVDDVDFCKSTWIELRFSYQLHARRLRQYFISGHKENRKRAAMYLESELMFLWRFIENRKTCSLPFEINESDNNDHVQFGTEDLVNQVIDDDLILVEAPVECIVIDEDDDKTVKTFKVTNNMKKLVQQIEPYPELYNSEHSLFKDYARKSYVWNSIANNLKDKATKLMKCWIIMQTRYEWELNNLDYTSSSPPPPSSELQKTLEFLKKYILENPDTVYKQSYYLKTAWHEPIDYFKDIYNLIVRMKKSADIVVLTDSLLKTPDKNKHYQIMWGEIANQKSSSPGQCETTWLIMRSFYWELMYMRQQSYQLTDKWYFESIITELYEISKSSQLAKQHQKQQAEKEKSAKTIRRQHHSNGTTNAPRTKSPIRKEMTTPQMTPAINNDLPPLSMISQPPQQQQQQEQQQQQHQQPPSLQGPLPKITGAISLAPQALTGAPLQIRPVIMSQNGQSLQSQILNGLQSSNTLITPVSAAISPAPAAPPAVSHANIQMSLNSLPHQTRVSTFSMPTVASVRSLAPTTIIHSSPPMPQISVRSFAQTKHISPPHNAGNIPQTNSILRNVRPPGVPTAIRTPVPNPNILNIQNNGGPATNTQMPTMINMTAGTKPLPINATASLISPQTQVVPVAIAAAKTEVPSMISSAPIGGTIMNGNPTPAVTSPSQLVSHPPLPKISGAVSLLNPNEILIELIASHNGNHLVVHGPPLSEKYQLSMPTVAKFIREVLAIPLLHNKRHNQPLLINSYWEHISQKFSLPPHICRACWNFLVENFNHFPQIAPLKELMAPFKTSLSVWNESHSLFKVFDDHCVSMGWLQHMSRLPEVVECIGGYPVLFQDVAKEALLEPASDMEVLCAWQTLRLRFPKIHDLQDIWTAIKNCFCQYMSDLEFGIDNKWPINWWRALARLKFLVEARYATSEPFYYIVSNKMVEEIERCAMLEMKARYNKNEVPPPKILKTEDIEDQIPAHELQTMELPQTPPPATSSSHLTSLLKPSLIPSELTAAELKPRKDVETVALLTAIQKRPEIYTKADYILKYEAWQQVAKELHMEVPDCLLAFRHATKNYCSYKRQDPISRCRLNQKYFKKMDEIFRSLPPSQIKKYSHLSMKSTAETSPASELVFPERYISDISMSNSNSNLVVKNWSFALGNLQVDNSFHYKMRGIINQYLDNKTDNVEEIIS